GPPGLSPPALHRGLQPESAHPEGGRLPRPVSRLGQSARRHSEVCGRKNHAAHHLRSRHQAAARGGIASGAPRPRWHHTDYRQARFRGWRRCARPVRGHGAGNQEGRARVRAADERLRRCPHDPAHLRRRRTGADERTCADRNLRARAGKNSGGLSTHQPGHRGEVTMKATVLSREQKQSAAESNPRSWRVAAAILALLVFLPVDTTAQKPPSPRAAVVSPPGVLVRLLDLNGSRLDVPAVGWLRSLSLSMNIPGSAFSGEVVFPGLRPGRYTVEAEAPGYVTTRETVEILSEGNFVVLLYMRPEPPRGVTAGPPGPPVLAPKARQEAEKGLQALQANNNLAKARKHLEVALHLAPNHPDVNYLWGILWLEENNWAQAKVFLEKSVSLDSKHRFGLVALSRLHYRQHEYAEAIGLLKRALELDPSSWRVHWLLASAYLRLSEFAKAREHAELALKSGKEKAGEAQLVLGQALAALGEKEKAWRALESFLNAYPTHP